ncbi:MAG: glycosyltransferase family 2 protein, partial [Bacilli bacterium]|nr:glycosyltransferase family 2 protein [Bacilli bacterium]
MIDIIIPVYNTPYADLERCLKSIENQTYKDYKVYIIDDGSKDSVKKQLDSYVSGKKNYFVKHIANAGVSNARNLGIESSNSKYLTFVDADDTIEPNFLSEAINLIEDNNLDLIIGGYHEIKDNEIVRTRVCLPGLHIYNNLNLKLFFEKLLSS